MFLALHTHYKMADAFERPRLKTRDVRFILSRILIVKHFDFFFQSPTCVVIKFVNQKYILRLRSNTVNTTEVSCSSGATRQDRLQYFIAADTWQPAAFQPDCEKCTGRVPEGIRVLLL